MTIAIVIATLSIVLCVISFLYLHWYINRKTSAGMFLADYRAEVEKLNAEIDAATDRDALLVEARIKKLQNVLADADRRIAVYVREMERRQTGATTQSNLAKQTKQLPQSQTETPVAPQSSAPSTTPLYTNLGRGGRGSIGSAGSGDRLGLRIVNVSEPEPAPAKVDVADNAAADNAGVNGVDHGEKKELRVQIAELAATGLSPAEIASQLRISRTEVELALSMLVLKKNTA